MSYSNAAKSGNAPQETATATSGGPCSLTSEWLTTKEAADYLRVSVGSLRNLTSVGRVPYYKFDRRNRYRLDDLRALLLTEKRGVYGS